MAKSPRNKKQRVGRFERLRKLLVRKAAGGALSDGRGLDQPPNKSSPLCVGGDNKISRSTSAGQTRSKESRSFHSDRLPDGLAYNQLIRSIERPFSQVPPDIRHRVEERTGHSIEASYEGFTRMLDAAIESSEGDDLIVG